MGKRTDLQNVLESILGSPNVYFQPPPSIMMKYPCIVYELAKIRTVFAENLPYGTNRAYTLKLISGDPDNHVIDSLLTLEKCVFERRYVSGNLYHDVFNIYY